MVLGCDPAPLLRTTDPSELLAYRVLVEHADQILDEQHERLGAHVAAKVSELFP